MTTRAEVRGNLQALPHQPPEVVAALVNAAAVLLIGVAVDVAAFLAMWLDTQHAVAIAFPVYHLVLNVVEAGFVVMACTPFAVVAAWRTWVHAVRYTAHQGTGWQGVAEGAAFGFLMAVWALAWGILHRPWQAWRYVAFYGGAAALLGTGIALALRSIALVTLRHLGPASRQPAGWSTPPPSPTSATSRT